MVRHNGEALTVLDRLVGDLRARDVAADDQERPAAIPWTKINVEFYRDPTDAVFKALIE